MQTNSDHGRVWRKTRMDLDSSEDRRRHLTRPNAAKRREPKAFPAMLAALQI